MGRGGATLEPWETHTLDSSPYDYDAAFHTDKDCNAGDASPVLSTSSTWLISCQPIVPSPLARTAQSSHGESLDTVAYPTGTAMAFTIGKTEGPYRADLPILTPPSTPSPPFPLLERQSTGLPLQIIGIPLNGIGDLVKAGPSPQNVIFSHPQCKPKCRPP